MNSHGEVDMDAERERIERLHSLSEQNRKLQEKVSILSQLST